MITSANIFEKIVSNELYLPENKKTVIYQIHCIKTNECPVKVWNFHDSSPMEFPPGSFIQGAIYPIVISKMQFDESQASFIGYRLLTSMSNIIPNYIPKNWNRSRKK